MHSLKNFKDIHNQYQPSLYREEACEARVEVISVAWHLAPVGGRWQWWLRWLINNLLIVIFQIVSETL